MTATVTRFDLICAGCGAVIPAGQRAWTSPDGDPVCESCKAGGVDKPAEPEPEHEPDTARAPDTDPELAREPEPKPEPDPVPEREPEPERFELDPEPAEPERNGKAKRRPKPNGNAGADLAALIRQIAETAEAQIDPDEVRRIAGETATQYTNAALVGIARAAAAEAVRTEIPAIRDAHTVRVHAAEAVRTIDGPVHPIVHTLAKVCGARLRRGHAPNVLMVGPAGCGKTTAAAHVAEALGLDFGFISLSGGISESHLIGRYAPTGEAGRFEYTEPPFVTAYRDGGVFVFDELDAADENVLIVINAALANGHLRLLTGDVVARHRDFVAIGCANTWGHGADRQYCGRNQLDGATLDRYAAARFFVDYDQTLERSQSDPELCAWAHALRRKVREAGLRRIVSTRFIFDASDLIACEAYTLDDAKRSLLADWSDNDLRTVGEVRP
jgi:hypothetical protein